MGRKSKRDEQLVMKVLNKSWAQLDKWLDDEEINCGEKAKTCIPLMAKSMPQNIRKQVDNVVRYISSIPRPDQIDPPTIEVEAVEADADCAVGDETNDVSDCDGEGCDCSDADT